MARIKSRTGSWSPLNEHVSKDMEIPSVTARLWAPYRQTNVDFQRQPSGVFASAVLAVSRWRCVGCYTLCSHCSWRVSDADFFQSHVTQVWGFLISVNCTNYHLEDVDTNKDRWTDRGNLQQLVCQLSGFLPNVTQILTKFSEHLQKKMIIYVCVHPLLWCEYQELVRRYKR